MDNKDFCVSLDRASKDILSNLVENMEKACITVEKTAKQNCHVDLGHLRSSITHSVDIQPSTIVGSVFSNLDYAPYEEKGTGIYAVDGDGRKTPWKYVSKAGKYKGGHTTKGQQPHPFLEPARDKNKDEVSNILGGKK